MLLKSPPFALRAALENKLTIDCSVNAVVASLPEAPPFKSIENGHSVCSCLRGSSIHCDEMPVNTLRVGTHRERDWGSPIGMNSANSASANTSKGSDGSVWVRTSVTIVVNARHEKDRPLRSARNQLLKIAPPSECARASPLRRVPSDGTILVKSGWSCSAVVPSQSFEADGCVHSASVIRSDSCCEFVSSPSALRSHPNRERSLVSCCLFNSNVLCSAARYRQERTTATKFHD